MFFFSQNLCCWDLHAFAWRKIEPKIVYVHKKITNIRYCIATLLWIVQLASSVGIELLSSSAGVASVKSAKGLRRTELERLGPGIKEFKI